MAINASQPTENFRCLKPLSATCYFGIKKYKYLLKFNIRLLDGHSTHFLILMES